MSAFTQHSQPAQVGKSALWVGCLIGTVAGMSLALIEPNNTEARAPQNHVQHICWSPPRSGSGYCQSKNKLRAHIHWLIGNTVTISSEYKTIYNLVLGENSGDYLLSVVLCFSIKTSQCDTEPGTKLELYAALCVCVCGVCLHICEVLKLKSASANHPLSNAPIGPFAVPFTDQPDTATETHE